MKTRLIFEYDKLIKKGKYETAKRLLRFLQRHRATLGLDDADYELEILFDKIGIKCTYVNRYGLWAEYIY